MDFNHIPTYAEPFSFIFSTHIEAEISPHEYCPILQSLKEKLAQKCNSDLINKHLPETTLLEIFPNKPKSEYYLKFIIATNYSADINNCKYSYLRYFLFDLFIHDEEQGQIKRELILNKSMQDFGEFNAIHVFINNSKPISTKELTKFTKNNLISVNKLSDLLSEKNISLFAEMFLEILASRLDELVFVPSEVISMSLEAYSIRLKASKNANEGEHLKIRGDLAMVFSSPDDAINYYQKASEYFFNETWGMLAVTKKFNKIWIGFIYESLCAFQFQKFQNFARQKNADMSQEKIAICQKIISLTDDALRIFVNNGFALAHFQLSMKFLDFLTRIGNRRLFLENFQAIKKHSDAKFYSSFLILYLGDQAAKIGLRRVALSCWCQFLQTTDLELTEESLETNYVFRCLKLLKLDIESYTRNPRKLETSWTVISSFILTKAIESSKQKSTLKSEQTLHFYLCLLNKNPKLEGIYNNLTSQINWENPMLVGEYPVLPYVTRIIPKNYTLRFKKVEETKKLDETEEDTNSASNIFIYDPRTADRKTKLNWSAEKKHKVEIFLTNPLPFRVKINRIKFQVNGESCVTNSEAVVLEGGVKNQKVTLKLKPVKPGLLEIISVDFILNKLEYSNRVDQFGNSQLHKMLNEQNKHAFGKFQSKKNEGITSLEIAESVPRIEVDLGNYVPEVIHFNENINLEYRITNKSKRVVKNVGLKIVVEFENAASKTVFRKMNDFILENGEVIFVDVLFFQSKTGILANQKKRETKKKEFFEIENENLVYRIYKISVEIEAVFSSNSKFAGWAILERNFKTFDFFGLIILDLNLLKHPVDLSDEVHLGFKIEILETYLSVNDIRVSLFDKANQSELQRVNLGTKNLMIVTDSKKQLGNLKDFNEKYEVWFYTNQFDRSGIINFTQKIDFQGT